MEFLFKDELYNSSNGFYSSNKVRDLGSPPFSSDRTTRQMIREIYGEQSSHVKSIQPQENTHSSQEYVEHSLGQAVANLVTNHSQ